MSIQSEMHDAESGNAQILESIEDRPEDRLARDVHHHQVSDRGATQFALGVAHAHYVQVGAVGSELENRVHGEERLHELQLGLLVLLAGPGNPTSRDVIVQSDG